MHEEHPVHHRVIARKVRRLAKIRSEPAVHHSPFGGRSRRGFFKQLARVSAWRQAKSWYSTAPSKVNGGGPPFSPKGRRSRRVKPQPTCRIPKVPRSEPRSKTSKANERRRVKRAGLSKKGSDPEENAEGDRYLWRLGGKVVVRYFVPTWSMFPPEAAGMTPGAWEAYQEKLESELEKQRVVERRVGNVRTHLAKLSVESGSKPSDKIVPDSPSKRSGHGRPSRGHRGRGRGGAGRSRGRGSRRT